MDSYTSMRTRQDMNAHFAKEEIQEAIQYMKKCSVSLVIREIEI